VSWHIEGDGSEELDLIRVARRMIDLVEAQVLDAIEERERTLCPWCDTQIAVDDPHCGSVRCRRLWGRELEHEARDLQ